MSVGTGLNPLVLFIEGYVPEYVLDVSNHPQGYIVTPEEYNNRFNLLRQQGDNQGKTIKDFFNLLDSELFGVNGAAIIKIGGARLDETINTLSTNLATHTHTVFGDAYQELKFLWDSTTIKSKGYVNQSVGERQPLPEEDKIYKFTQTGLEIYNYNLMQQTILSPSFISTNWISAKTHSFSDSTGTIQLKALGYKDGSLRFRDDIGEVDITGHVRSAHAPADANNYVHPDTHSPSIILQDTNNRFVTDAEKTAWNAKATSATINTAINAHSSNYYSHTRIGTKTDYSHGMDFYSAICSVYANGDKVELTHSTTGVPQVINKLTVKSDGAFVNAQKILTGSLKTINGVSIQGTGDISTVETLKTINGISLKGSGDIVIEAGGGTSVVFSDIAPTDTTVIWARSVTL